jgi:ribosomal subunit interface protein
MELSITGRHCTVPETLRARVAQRIQTLTRLEPRVDSAFVAFEEDHGVKRAEARVCIAGAQTMIAHGSGNTFPDAFRAAVDRLSRQMRRRVERRRSHHASKPSENETGG